MTQKTVKKKKRRRISVASVILVLGIVMLMIPVIFFGFLLYDATLGTVTPMFGNRFKNDLNPAISSEQTVQIDTTLKGLANVETVSVSLKAATLRITVDTLDALDAAGVKTITTSVYDTIQAVLPMETYFTADETKKMYDLEIHVLNLKNGKDQAGYFYFILTKNANMEKFIVQEVSKPLNAELAQQLRDALNPPEATPTGSVSGPIITMGLQEGIQPSFTL
ncbi:MAG: hypothetical protein E4G74_00945 [Erysipelotrichales bacterium]|nr:MAG: hypothetical protein E4G74_00945 [Erysipelotrichales bacterium]